MAAGRWEKLDVAAKVFLGLAGLSLSCVLAWGEYGDRDRERVRKGNEDRRLEEESYTREFQAYYSMARAAREDSELVRFDLDIASAIASRLAGAPFRKPFYSHAVVALRARFAPDAGSSPSDGRSAVAGLTLQANEASPSSDAARSSDEWFAVIGSYDISDAGRRSAENWAATVRSSLGCAEIWRTRVSNSYAVVLGGRMRNFAEALQAAQRARRLEVAPDAFIQANRQWSRISACP